VSTEQEMDCDDRCWAIITELAPLDIVARLDFLPNGVPFVRVLLDDYLVVDCQIDLNAQMRYSIYVRRYSLDGTLESEARPYQSNSWQHAAKCVELAHRVHEKRIREDLGRIMEEFTSA